MVQNDMDDDFTHSSEAGKSDKSAELHLVEGSTDTTNQRINMKIDIDNIHNDDSNLKLKLNEIETASIPPKGRRAFNYHARRKSLALGPIYNNNLFDQQIHNAI